MKKVTRYEVKSASAVRALYQEGRGRLPKVSYTFETFDGETIEFDLDIMETARLIDESVIAYEAAIPQIKKRKR